MRWYWDFIGFVTEKIVDVIVFTYEMYEHVSSQWSRRGK